jgi:Ca2+:H+ antiporter
VTRRERVLLAAVAVLVAVAGVGRYAGGISSIAAFVLAGAALAGLAWIVSVGVEQVGERFGTPTTSTLQATVGNLPEFFVVLFALNAGDETVAKTAILGSILVNALLVLGVVLIVGALASKGQLMKFSSRLPNDATTLLLVASFIIVLVALVNSSHNIAGRHTETISIVGACAILVVYASWLRQYLRSGGGLAAGDSTRATPRVPIMLSLSLLVVAGIGSAFVSDWFVHALEPTVHKLHISQAFAGLVIVAIAGNAVENVAGIVQAHRGNMDLAISLVKSSVAQIAAFLYPVLVLVSLLTATHLTFQLAPVYVGALIAAAVLVWQITGDGEATPFEGAALISTFIVLATVAAFEH